MPSSSCAGWSFSHLAWTFKFPHTDQHIVHWAISQYFLKTSMCPCRKINITLSSPCVLLPNLQSSGVHFYFGDKGFRPQN